MKKLITRIFLGVFLCVSVAQGATQINPATQIQGVSGAPSGTGALCLTTSCAMVTPALGTPSALVGTNITGTAAGFTAQNAVNVTGTVASGVTATTQAISDDSTKIATTAFVSAIAEDFKSVTGTAGAGALTFTVAAGQHFKFRSATLADGVPVNLQNTSILSVVVPDGSTLGSTSTQLARLYYAVFNDAGTLRLAVINATSASILDEDELQTTIAVSGASNALNTWYSTVAVSTPAAYRVVGFVEAVNTTGSWASPTTVQPGGGLALAVPITQLSLFGSVNDVTASRAVGTTYTNNTTKPMFVSVRGTTNSTGLVMTLTISGAILSVMSAGASNTITVSGIVPAGASYLVTQTGTTFTLNGWVEIY